MSTTRTATEALGVKATPMTSVRAKTRARRSRSRRLIRYGTAGVAFASAGAGIIIVTPVTVPAPRAQMADVLLTSGGTEDVYIDIVRHAAPTPPPPDFTSETPGPDLCAVLPVSGTCGGGSFPGWTGTEQANFTANTLYNEFGPVSGVFSGNSLRDLETGQAYAAVLNNHGALPPAVLPTDGSGITPGFPDISQLWQLNEAYSSLFLPQATLTTLGGELYQLEVLAWAFGATLLPMPGGVPNTGVQLDNDFTQGVDAMYANATANPITSLDGNIHEVGFNNDASIFTWTMLNMQNPDLLYFIPAIFNQLTSSITDNGTSQLLDFGGIVEFNGSPGDWTLDSFNGTAIPAFPDPLTESFVLSRDLILPLQALVYNSMASLFSIDLKDLGGTLPNVFTTLGGGIQNIISSIIQTPINFFDYVKTAVTDPALFLASFSTSPSDLVSPGADGALPAAAADPSLGGLLSGLNPGDLANLFPSELTGLMSGELGSMVNDALTLF